MNRHRQRGALAASSSIPKEQQWVDCNNTSFTAISSVGGLNQGSVQTMDDVLVPNFHERVAAGEVFFNPMYAYRETVISSNGNGPTWQANTPFTCSGQARKHTIRYNGDYCQYLASACAGAYTGNMINEYLISDTDVAALVTEASTRVSSQRGRAANDMFESVAEIRESLASLKQLALKGGAVVSHFRKNAPATGLRGLKGGRNETDLLQAAADDWLLYRYGLRPIIKDIDGVMKGLKAAVGPKRSSTRAYSKHSVTSSRQVSVVNGGITDNVIIKTTDSVNVRAVSLDEFVATELSNLGFTSKAFFSLGWELIPYSFVVDWILNIGDFVGALEPAFGYRSLGECYVTRRERETIVTPAGTFYNAGSGYSVVSPTSGSCTASRFDTHRVPSLPTGIVIRNDFRFTELPRVLDALTLLAQKMR